MYYFCFIDSLAIICQLVLHHIVAVHPKSFRFDVVRYRNKSNFAIHKTIKVLAFGYFMEFEVTLGTTHCFKANRLALKLF